MRPEMIGGAFGTIFGALCIFIPIVITMFRHHQRLPASVALAIRHPIRSFISVLLGVGAAGCVLLVMMMMTVLSPSFDRNSGYWFGTSMAFLAGFGGCTITILWVLWPDFQHRLYRRINTLPLSLPYILRNVLLVGITGSIGVIAGCVGGIVGTMLSPYLAEWGGYALPSGLFAGGIGGGIISSILALLYAENLNR